MKLKKLLSFALALCMVLAFVPAFTLTAAASDYTVSDLIGFATTTTSGYVFDGSYATTGTGFNGTTNSDTALSNVTTPSVWAGWDGKVDGTNSWPYTSGSGKYDGNNVIDTTGININGYTTGSVNYIQSYGLAVGTEGAIIPSDAVQTGTAGKDFIIVEWTSTATSSNTEHDYGLYDADGNVFDSWRILANGAWGPYYADNAGGAASFGSNQTYSGLSYSYNSGSYWQGSGGSGYRYRIVYENVYDDNGENAGYTATYTYSSDGSTFTDYCVKTFSSGNVNGISKIGVRAVVSGNWYNNTRVGDLKIYAGNYPAATNTVTVTYKVEGTEVDSASGTYDTSSSDYYTFAEKYLYYNGEVYYAEEQQLSADKEVEMTLVEHYLSSNLKGKSQFTYNNNLYVPADDATTFESVIVNGNFITGDASGWTNRVGTDITGHSFTTDDSVDGIVMTGSTGNASATTSIGTAWDVTTGTTYYMSFYMYYTELTTDNYKYNFISDTRSSSSNILLSFASGTSANTWNHIETVFEAPTDTVYFQSSYAVNLELAAVELVPVERVENVEYYDLAITLKNGDKDVATYELTDVVEGTESVTVPAGMYNGTDGKYYLAADTAVAVTLSGDTYVGTCDVLDPGNVYTLQSGSLYSSANGYGTATTNPAFSAYTWSSSLTSPDRIGIAIVEVPSIDDTKTYQLTATQLRAYADGNKNLNTYFYMIPLETYINDVDVSSNSDLTNYFTDEYLIAHYNKTVQDDDTKSQEVYYDLDTTTISQYAGQTVVIIGTSTIGLYGLDSDIAITPVDKPIGVSLVNGAQIRIGEGVDENTNKITDGSGIRFIATVSYDETLAGVADEIGIAIWDGGFDTAEFDANTWTADESTIAYPIRAEKFQNTGLTVFTAAITDIAEANFNRIYIAAPYVTVNGETTYGTPVARTPYEVAAGILANGDTTGQTYTSDNLVAVLNAYANQTGARIELTYDATNGYGVAEATYANGAEAFFTAAISEDNGTYTITLTTDDSTQAIFYDYASSYYRVNGASATAFKESTLFSDVDVQYVDQNTVTITFTPASTSSDSGTELKEDDPIG